MPGPRDRIRQPALDYDPDAGRESGPDRGSAADLRLRLDRLPPGHPSGPSSPSRPATGDRRLAGQPARHDLPERPDAAADRDRAAGGAGDGAVRAEPSQESWQRELPRFRARWAEIRARWSRPDSTPPDRGRDEPGAWRGDSGRTLGPEQNRQVDAYCDDLGDREQQITARLEALERSSSGHLVGREFRRKGPDRLKDKVAAVLEHDVGAGVWQVLADVPGRAPLHNAVRERTIREACAHDIACLRAQGFELVKLRNLWGGPEYKGVNSQWLDCEYRPAP